MLPLCLVLLSVFICLSSADEKLCYGSAFVLPREHLRVYNQKVIFVPSNGGATKVVKGNGEVMDPRFRPTLRGGAEMPDLTEQDNGEFFMKFGFTNTLVSITTLRIIDCRKAETKDYGSSFSLRLPEEAQFLEFTPAEKLDVVTILWNRTSPNGSRGSVNRYYWKITDVTQEDNGYYKFRGINNRLLDWKKLIVKAKQIDLHPYEGKRLLIEYHQNTSIWTIIFKPVEELESHLLMKEGTPQWNVEPFERRLQFIHSAIIIEPVLFKDSGTFEFRDKKNNLVQHVKVEVNMVEVNMGFTEEEVRVPMPAYFFFVVIPSGVVICCCCIKKCCCKTSSPKRNNPAPMTTAAPTDTVVPPMPAVHHHDSTQPTGRGRSSTSPVPKNLPVYREPTSTSGGPPGLTQPTGRGPTATSAAPGYSHQPLQPHVYRQPTPTSHLLNVTAPEGSEASASLLKGSNFSSSDSDPKFVLKQSSFLSTPPLNADTTISDVYTSGKLSLSEIHTSAIPDVYTSDKLNFKY